MLEIRGLTKFFGGLEAVSNVDMTVQAGRIMGLIGPNGAGKTTLFNLLTGVIRPTRGSVIFEGEDITGKKPHNVAKKGMIRTFQATNIYPDFTVLDNIVLSYRLRHRSLHEIAYTFVLTLSIHARDSTIWFEVGYTEARII